MKITLKGGSGSGNFGHTGRPGKVGGSVDSGATLSRDDLIDGNPDIQDSFDMYDRTSKVLANRWNPDPEGLQQLLDEEGIKPDPGVSGKEAVAYYYLRKWGGSSGGPHISVMASHLLGKLGYKVPDGFVSDDVNTYMQSHPKVKQALQSFGDAMYSTTQEWFKNKGITHVKLYRAGFKDDATRVFTSWSSDWGGMRHDPNRVNRAAVVPVRQILSIPPTGFGTLTETEAVVLGNVE